MLSAAQAAPRTLQIDPLTAALGFAHIHFEQPISPAVSLYVGPHLRLYDGLLSDTPEPYIGLGVEAGVRWFPRQEAPEGMWLMVRGVGSWLKSDSGATGPGGYGSALVGRTWILSGWLVLSGGAGAQVIEYTIDGMGTQGVFPALHTAVGVAF